ncbi:MAG TPA: c-type cytochrome [Acetobacteraceae bacterium]|nr:c-type cytochrome [Acetobacteraceae bacterium]
MKPQHRMLRILPAVAVAAILAGSGPATAANDSNAQPAPGLAPPSGDVGRVPLGELVEAPETNIGAEITNPVAGQPQAVAEGQQLFMQMNCASCHGYDAKGGMGPDLTGKYWRYGGTPAAIYNSIYEGRPQGMPAWGKALPPQAIWLVVAYIQSLGGAFPAEAYQASLQGDRPGEQVAPELSFEAGLSGLAPSTPQGQGSPNANPQPPSGSGQR